MNIWFHFKTCGFCQQAKVVARIRIIAGYLSLAKATGFWKPGAFKDKQTAYLGKGFCEGDLDLHYYLSDFCWAFKARYFRPWLTQILFICWKYPRWRYKFSKPFQLVPIKRILHGALNRRAVFVNIDLFVNLWLWEVHECVLCTCVYGKYTLDALLGIYKGGGGWCMGFKCKCNRICDCNS